MTKDEHVFLRIAAIAGVTTGVSTFLLWLLPRLYLAPNTIEETMALAQNPYYMSRQWVNFFHIPLALTAYFALAYVLRKRELAKVIMGFMWFLIWGLTEMIGIAGIIFAVNNKWRINYPEAPEAQQVILKANIDLYFDIWNSLFFVLLLGFILGTAFYGWATWKGKGLEKILSYLFWLAVPLTLLIFFSRYLNVAWAGMIVGFIYPILQPVSRVLLGVYLWKSADKLEEL